MKIDFLKNIKIFFSISLILCFFTLFFLFKNGLNLGLEFVGGIEIELESDKFVEFNYLSNSLKNFHISKIKYFGSKNNFQLKLKGVFKDIDSVINDIKNELPSYIKIIKFSYIGPELNKENILNSVFAIFLSILFMLAYLCFRFEYKMAFASIISLFHDIFILVGIISFLKLEFNIIILFSIFTTFGYSINDTIIVFDRIRENFILNKEKDIYYIINLSINKTLSRTLFTSFSTLLVVAILMFFSGEYIFDFALVFFIGILIGTYSSIYIASSLLLFLKIRY